MTTKQAFSHCAAEYARYRPGYPEDVVGLLDREVGRSDERIVADVGAGTGIFSRMLARCGWRVIAVEPDARMLVHVCGGNDDAFPIRRVCAAAEATGLDNESVTAVTVAQAFHWFNPPYALAEFARVLRPGGVLLLVWNNREAARSAFAMEYERLIGRYNPSYDREYRVQDWAGKIAASGLFEPAKQHELRHVWRLDREGIVGFSRSVSYIRNVLSGEDMPRFEADLGALVERHFGDGPCEILLRTDVWTGRRI